LQDGASREKKKKDEGRLKRKIPQLRRKITGKEVGRMRPSLENAGLDRPEQTLRSESFIYVGTHQREERHRPRVKPASTTAGNEKESPSNPRKKKDEKNARTETCDRQQRAGTIGWETATRSRGQGETRSARSC